MKRFVLIAALGVASFGLAGCGDRETADSNGAGNVIGAEGGAGTVTEGSPVTTSATGTAFPKGARIIEEGGVTYRVDADGTRVRLGDNESRIVLENGTRFRVDPDGSRVRISEQGLEVDLDDDVNVRVGDNPSVEINTGR